MDQQNEKINLLLLKLENLMARQQFFEAEINQLRQELHALKFAESFPTTVQESRTFPEPTVEKITTLPPKNTPISTQQYVPKATAPSFTERFRKENIRKSDFEKFIGENLISTIGILILVLGVAIGAKLAIDKGLISPLTRIILGYAVGAALLGFSLKLKAKFEGFSAVLLSGAIAILYFITYAAYAYYQLIPQSLTFGLMVIFTSFTVVAAIKYNRQIIAHIGLVGAYAIPFLLSDGSGKVSILFSYIAIINLGILALAFTKYWKSLFYVSFALTWIIFLGWRIPVDDGLSYIKISMLFSSIYFATFYLTNLAYKIIRKEEFELSDVVILLLNSFVFYGAGYYTLTQSAKGTELLGLFTLANAVIHFVVSLAIYRLKLANKNLFYFVLALVITFITMAVPVQLSGNWVTVFWAVEAAILFILAKVKKIDIYEKLALPLVFLAFCSLVQDWVLASDLFNYQNEAYSSLIAFWNVNFLSNCVFIAAFTAMLLVSRKTMYKEENAKNSVIADILSYAIPTILIIVIYYTIRTEIAVIFENLYESTKIKVSSTVGESHFIYNLEYPFFSTVCIYIYSIFFAAALTFINLKKLKSKELAVANLVINLCVIVAFLTHGLYILTYLREIYMGTNVFYVAPGEQPNIKYFEHGPIHIWIRYIAYAFFALLIFSCYQLSKSPLFKARFKTAFDYLLYLAILWLLSSELLNVLELNGLKTGYKLGLSILWGVYSLLLIGLGLWKNKKYLRIGAIILFGITLLKLFFYDLSSLDTISKTIVFVSLGVLLLIISFLYNKYKHLVNNDVKTEH